MLVLESTNIPWSFRIQMRPLEASKGQDLDSHGAEVGKGGFIPLAVAGPVAAGC